MEIIIFSILKMVFFDVILCGLEIEMSVGMEREGKVFSIFDLCKLMNRFFVSFLVFFYMDWILGGDCLINLYFLVNII